MTVAAGHRHRHGVHPDEIPAHHHHHGDPAPEPVDPETAAALDREHWKVENVELVTVGIDIGSSTSHLMFSHVHLQRLAQALSSRFVVVARTVLWRSPIVLTPYRDDETIDAEALDGFVADCYREAGFRREDVDTGAVILTGEALKRRNARALADLFADESGRFVCASAGHHLECAMAAHGSGAVGLSRRTPEAMLHVDIGGGTSKLALVRDGEVLDTAAMAVGGRLVAVADGVVTRVEQPAREVAERAGVDLAVGAPLPEEAATALVGALADALAELIGGEVRSELGRALLVTDPPDWPVAPASISFSGGVAEYLYGREREGFGDLAPALARAVAERVDARRPALTLVEPPHGIRATVIGASQFSVQVSGNTVNVSDPASLPRHNIPVLHPGLDLDGEIHPGEVAGRIADAARRMDLLQRPAEVAVAVAWRGDPSHARLRALAEGVLEAFDGPVPLGGTLIVLLEGDVARSLGRLLLHELGLAAPLICLDGLELREFDFVDIGTVIEPTGVVPVVIKSLLFGAAGTREHRVRAGRAAGDALTGSPS
ncbi:MAG: ethanolamine utilization protein EutA [Solirubrobacteraceae bacterium]|nr:ethanolamine utilization protein EutA [Solirubrobacteraceae bacterium]